MRKYKLDYGKSKEVYENCKRYIEIKQCYNNVFNIVTDYNSKFRSGEWSVAYGYVEVMPMLYCRHCFIIDENGNAVDPTICTNTEPNINREYLLMTEFTDIDEYLNAIEQDNLLPALDRYLLADNIKAQNWAKEQGYIFI